MSTYNDFDMSDDDDYEGPDAYLGDEGDEDDDLEVELEELTDGASDSPNAVPFGVERILASLFSMQSNPQGASRGNRVALGGLTLQELRMLLGRTSSDTNAGARFTVEPEDDEDDSSYYVPRPDRPTEIQQWFPPVTEPQKAGQELLMSGEFGRVGSKMKTYRNKWNISRQIDSRASKPRPYSHKEDIGNALVPNSNGVAVASYSANVYSGQFSADSSFYYTCSQDWKLHVYDMKSPTRPISPLNRRTSQDALGNNIDDDPDLVTTMKVIKSVQGRPGRWTITDSHLSPDNERLIYSSITPTVYMTSTLGSSLEQTPIHFSDPPRYGGFHSDYEDSFGIWSCRFSADGNEVVAGGSGKLFVYDLLANKRTVKINAHHDDVNSCCWADTSSGNILVSASDDTFLKVWDRRSLGSSQKPSGVLVGHTEGITNVSAKGDGRYLISNGKDQALRLWDLRKMHSSHEFDKFSDAYYGQDFDYRYQRYRRPKHKAHPRDCSVMTYRGHAVLRTLIRCNFSPAETTGSQYIYSGSADGKIHIWSLDGRIVQVLDRAQTLPITFDPSGTEMEPTQGQRRNVCVRDVSWHSQEPVIMSAGWDAGSSGSIIARHEWKGLSKLPGRLEDWIEKKASERAERASMRDMRPGRQHIPGAFVDDDDER